MVILAWTGLELSRGQASDWHTDWHTDAGNDNTQRPKLTSGKNRRHGIKYFKWQHWIQYYCWCNQRYFKSCQCWWQQYMKMMSRKTSLGTPYQLWRPKALSNYIFSHMKINSFWHKYAHIHGVLLNDFVYYLTISETKIDMTFPNALFHVEGFYILRQANTSSIGGLLIYIRSSFPHQRPSDTEVNENGIESTCVELTIAKCKSVISCIYKHPQVPNGVFMVCITKIADPVLCYSTDCVLIGDMDCCPIKSNILLEFCDIYGMNTLIKDGTCNKCHVPSLLDVILGTNAKRYAGIINTECGLSDYHNIIWAETKRPEPFRKPRKIHYPHTSTLPRLILGMTLKPHRFILDTFFYEVDDIAWFSSKLLVTIINDHALLKNKYIKTRTLHE